jgi:molybdate transport system regulatory protein
VNSFKAKITDIQSTRHLSMVSLAAGDVKLKSIVIDTASTCDYLLVGKEVHVIFKEMEVSISTQPDLPISLQNEITGKITRLEIGEILSKVTLETEVGTVVSVISTNSAERLGLKEEQQVYAMIKTNEIMLSAE